MKQKRISLEHQHDRRFCLFCNTNIAPVTSCESTLYTNVSMFRIVYQCESIFICYYLFLSCFFFLFFFNKQISIRWRSDCMDRHGLSASCVFSAFLLFLLAGEGLKDPTPWLSIFGTELTANKVERTQNYHVLSTNA